MADGSLEEMVNEVVFTEESARKLAQETGARSLTLHDYGGLSAAYSAIGSELARQYLVGYMPTGAGRGDGTFRRVTVSLRDRADLVVRARPGYVPAQPVGSALATTR